MKKDNPTPPSWNQTIDFQLGHELDSAIIPSPEEEMKFRARMKKKTLTMESDK